MAFDNATTAIGGLAAVCTTLSFVPQLVKIRRQGGQDLSDGMLALYLLGLGLWLAYGIRIGAAEVIGANVVAGTLVLAAVAMKHGSGASRSSARTLGPDGRDEIAARVKRLRPDSPRQWGEMTAHQMVCHLTDCNRMATGDLVVAPEQAWMPRSFVKWVSLYTPLPWPKGLPTNPELDQDRDGIRPGDFAADVAALEASIERLASRTGPEWPRHPNLGSMSRCDWLRWGYRHMDHHLRQFGL